MAIDIDFPFFCSFFVQLDEKKRKTKQNKKTTSNFNNKKRCNPEIHFGVIDVFICPFFIFFLFFFEIAA